MMCAVHCPLLLMLLCVAAVYRCFVLLVSGMVAVGRSLMSGYVPSCLVTACCVAFCSALLCYDRFMFCSVWMSFLGLLFLVQVTVLLFGSAFVGLWFMSLPSSLSIGLMVEAGWLVHGYGHKMETDRMSVIAGLSPWWAFFLYNDLRPRVRRRKS